MNHFVSKEMDLGTKTTGLCQNNRCFNAPVYSFLHKLKKMYWFSLETFTHIH